MLLPSESECPYPVKSNDVHHEVELIVALGGGGSDIAEPAALEHVYGYAVGMDMTRRDLWVGQEDGPTVGGGQGLRAFRPH